MEWLEFRFYLQPIQFYFIIVKRSEESAGGSPSFYIAMIYSSIGDPDEAFN